MFSDRWGELAVSFVEAMALALQCVCGLCARGWLDYECPCDVRHCYLISGEVIPMGLGSRDALAARLRVPLGYIGRCETQIYVSSSTATLLRNDGPGLVNKKEVRELRRCLPIEYYSSAAAELRLGFGVIVAADGSLISAPRGCVYDLLRGEIVEVRYDGSPSNWFMVFASGWIASAVKLQTEDRFIFACDVISVDVPVGPALRRIVSLQRVIRRFLLKRRVLGGA